MATFPTAKVHRVDRRRLGRGQFVQLPVVSCVVEIFGDVATLTFSSPVVVNGSLDLHFVGRTLLTQTQISSTTFALTYDGPIGIASYSGIPAGSSIVQSMLGGQFVGVPPAFYSLYAHYDATLLTLGDGDPVPLWADASGNGNDASLTTGLAPQFDTNVLNGLPGVLFSLGHYLSNAALAVPIASPYTIACVCQFDTVGAISFLLARDVGSTPIFGITATHYVGNAGTGNLAPGTPDTDPHLLVFSVAGNASTSISLDGVELIAGDVGSGGYPDFTLGNGSDGLEPTLGHIFEMVIGRGATPALFNNYLLTKWGLF